MLCMSAVALLPEGVGRNQGLYILDRWQGVALLAEGVGRNCRQGRSVVIGPDVALLAEGVGRNSSFWAVSTFSRPVALLAEGVGRNCPMRFSQCSQSSRPPRGGRG